MYKIPIYQPSLRGNEKKYVNECLDSNWISSKGKFISLFENQFASHIGARFAISVTNGTVGLHLALLAAGIGPGDEVIVPTLTYVASVNAIAYTGATPVFVDSLEETWQMDPSEVLRKVSSKTKAIMVVHLYGHPCEMDMLVKIAKENNLLIIEDCAEAFGSYYKKKHVGLFGDIAVFSFFGNKTMTTGEGGMVVMSEASIYEKAVRYKGQGLARDREYWHDLVGYNYRMTNICAAIGLAQLEQVKDFIDRKRAIALRYQQQLSFTFHPEMADVEHSYWMCSILVDHPQQRDPLRHHLKQAGIETRPLFYPIHTLLMYKQEGAFFPVAERLSARGINLPSWPDLKNEDVDFICQEIARFTKK